MSDWVLPVHREYQGQHSLLTKVNVWVLLSVCYHEEEINSPSLWVFQTFQTQGIGFEVWSWGALWIKQLGDHRAQVGISNHLSDDTSITWWTLLPWHSVACMLWFVPLREGHPKRTTARDESSCDVKDKGKLQFFPSGWGNLGSNWNSVMVSSEWKGKGLNFAKVREKWNKHCGKYSKPLCCFHKGCIASRSREDWDLTHEKN